MHKSFCFQGFSGVLATAYDTAALKKQEMQISACRAVIVGYEACISMRQYLSEKTSEVLLVFDEEG